MDNITEKNFKSRYRNFNNDQVLCINKSYCKVKIHLKWRKLWRIIFLNLSNKLVYTCSQSKLNYWKLQIDELIMTITSKSIYILFIGAFVLHRMAVVQNTYSWSTYKLYYKWNVETFLYTIFHHFWTEKLYI